MSRAVHFQTKKNNQTNKRSCAAKKKLESPRLERWCFGLPVSLTVPIFPDPSSSRLVQVTPSRKALESPLLAQEGRAEKIPSCPPRALSQSSLLLSITRGALALTELPSLRSAVCSVVCGLLRLEKGKKGGREEEGRSPGT